jgi:ABC-type transport system substrate-binding protein
VRHDEVDELIAEATAGKIDRRQFVWRLAALGLAPSAIATLVAACGGGGDEAGAPQTSTGGGVSIPASAVPGFKWEGGTPGGEATVSWPDDSLIFDPPVTYGTGAYYGIHNFYRGLLFFGGDPAVPQPDLAESFDVSSDGKRYNFKIRQGVLFHNGRELKAEDFKYTYERTAIIEGTWAGPFIGRVNGYQDYLDKKAKEISGIKVLGKYELELALDAPDVTVLKALSIVPFLVVPKEEVEGKGDQWPVSPVGTGPFQLEKFNDAESTYRATKFKDYIYGEHLPYLDALTWEWNKTPEVAVLRVQRGESDSMVYPPSSALAKLEGNEGLQKWDNLELRYYALNLKAPPLNNKKVRQGLNYAFNRERARRFLVVPTGRYYPTTLFGYDDTLKGYSYDPERARSLLKEGGYDGQELVALVHDSPSTPGHEEVFQLLQQDLKDVGVKLTLKKGPGDVSDHAKEIRAGDFDMWAVHWGMGMPDPVELASSLFGTGAPLNFGGYGNAEIDKLNAKGVGQSDSDARAQTYAEIERMLLDDAPFIFLGGGIVPTFRTTRVQNFFFEPILWEHWDRYWVS